MNEPQTAGDYQEREVQAVKSVLIELVQVCGGLSRGFVVVGGSVPWLLLDAGEPPHVGTIDIDLDLDPEALSEGRYASLIEQLVKRGYQRGQEGLKPFQLRRSVPIDEGD